MQSNDSPEIPDRGGDIRRARPPFGCTSTKLKRKFMNWWHVIYGTHNLVDLRSKDWRFQPRQCQEHKKNLWEYFWVKNAVLTCCQCAQLPSILCTHKNNHVRTHKKNHILTFHVRVWWIMETRKRPEFAKGEIPIGTTKCKKIIK